MAVRKSLSIDYVLLCTWTAMQMKPPSPDFTCNVSGRQSKVDSLIMWALIPAAVGCLLRTHASTLARSSAFTITISARGQNQQKKTDEKPWCIRDETRQPLQFKMGSGSLSALPFSCNWGSVHHCAYRPQRCSVSDTQSSKQSADCCFGRTVKVCPPLSDGWN